MNRTTDDQLLAAANALDASYKAAAEFDAAREDRLGDWVDFTKRTNDPKLGYLEMRLTERGIPHRRHGRSWHAPILQVQKKRLDAADEMLTERHGRYRLDDVRDDHPKFKGWPPHDWDGTDEGEEDAYDTLRKAALSRGQP